MIDRVIVNVALEADLIWKAIVQARTSSNINPAASGAVTKFVVSGIVQQKACCRVGYYCRVYPWQQQFFIRGLYFQLCRRMGNTPIIIDSNLGG